ncbi:MAG: glutathione peroxidase [Homoserinimonas sp.]|nr:glutathione peroxidase [Homoserinimonas sp.]MCW5945300.1 glutathione peroxidase [Cryobacterium sp.]
MSLNEIPLVTIDGDETTFGDVRSSATLVVNVASKCGHTPQYGGLEKLFEKYSSSGLTILGFPCNQFMLQEPGSAEQIKEFCSLNYGVTFPLFEKIKVNGKHTHPLYRQLKLALDSSGEAGDVKWNFEKFLIEDDDSIQRFRSKIEPESFELVSTIENALSRR